MAAGLAADVAGPPLVVTRTTSAQAEPG